MARLVANLTVCTRGLNPLFECILSLQESLSVAHCSWEFGELLWDADGVAFEGNKIASMDMRISGLTAFMSSTPTFWMPMFACEVSRRVPGVKVSWRGAWPHFSASDDDDPTEDEPCPTAPEKVHA